MDQTTQPLGRDCPPLVPLRALPPRPLGLEEQARLPKARTKVPQDPESVEVAVADLHQLLGRRLRVPPSFSAFESVVSLNIGLFQWE